MHRLFCVCPVGLSGTSLEVCPTLERCTSHSDEGGWVESKLYVGMVLVVFGRWLGEGVFLYYEECQACFFRRRGYCAVLCDGNA